MAIGRVAAAGGIVKKREKAGGRISATAIVKHEGICTDCCVLYAGRVEQQRCSAHRGIGTPVVEHQGSTANTGVKASVGIGKERTPTNRCISSADDIATECIVTEKSIEEAGV